MTQEYLTEKYKLWCKETKRNGVVLVGGSMYEFFKWMGEQPIPQDINIEAEAEKRYMDSRLQEIFIAGAQLLLPQLQECKEQLAQAKEEAERLKELLSDIDKSLYLGGDLNDKEILDWYIEVTKTVKESISETLKQQTHG